MTWATYSSEVELRGAEIADRHGISLRRVREILHQLLDMRRQAVLAAADRRR